MFVGETGLDEGASVYADWRQPTFRIPPTSSHGFSDRHRNVSAVSLCSLAGSDVSTSSMTYVAELPQGSSLFYEGPREDSDI